MIPGNSSPIMNPKVVMIHPAVIPSFKVLFYAVEMLCTVVVSRNGLHSHGDTHHNHDKEHLDTVEDTECTDGHITSIIEQTVVDENHDAAGTHIHNEGDMPMAKILAMMCCFNRML